MYQLSVFTIGRADAPGKFGSTTRGKTKHSTEGRRSETVKLSWFFSCIKNAANSFNILQLYQMAGSGVAESNQCTSEGWALEPQCVICQIYLISNMHVCIGSFQWMGLTFIFSILDWWGWSPLCSRVRVNVRKD